MKVTNDHYGFKSGDPESKPCRRVWTSDAWEADEDTIFIKDDSGTFWAIRSGANGGILVRCIGNERGHDQIIIVAQASNEIVLRSEK